MKLAVAVEASDVDVELHRLGLSREALYQAARYGEWARRGCHRYDPPSYPGVSRYAHTMRNLRLQFASLGWIVVNVRGAAFILSADKKTAITTAAGNEDTGNPSRVPKTKFPKGALAVELARKNMAQLTLSTEVFPPDKQLTSKIPADATAYYLLVARHGRDLVAELSVPVEFDEGGNAVSWRPRLILGKFSVGEQDAVIRPEEPDRIEIDIRPRNGS